MTSSILDGLSPADRAEVDALRRREVFPDGAWLFRQGEIAECAYEVIEGELELRLAVPGSDALPVAIIGPGGWVGEPAIVGPSERTMSAIARGRLVVDALDRADFAGLRHGLRPAALQLMLAIARLVGERVLVADGVTIHPGPSARDVVPAPSLAAEPDSAFDPRPYLGKLPFFSRFSPRDRDGLLARGRLVDLGRGREILRAGQRTAGCAVVVRGAVEILHGEHAPRVGLLGPGTVFGHLGPLLGAPASADCRVRERATLLLLGPDALTDLLGPNGRLSYRFVEALCHDLLDGLARADRVLAQFENRRRMGGQL